MRKFLLSAAFTAASFSSLLAYDFVSVNADGKDIYYNILSESECEVTHNGYTSYSGKVTIPQHVTYGGKEYTVSKIGNNAFIGCWDWEDDKLLDVHIPNTVTCIGEYAFSECYYMRSLTLPESIEVIESRAFQACMTCASINIPSTVKSIGNNAFEDCTELRQVTIPSGLKHLGDQAFFRCGAKEINVDEGNLYYASIDGVLFNKEKTKLIQFPMFRNGDYTVPDGVTEIADYAFAFSNDLNSVTLPNSLTTIGNNAFEGAFLWSSDFVLTIPNSVTTIGQAVFSYASGLHHVVLPTSISEIPERMFEASNLVSIAVPDNITSIGMGAFSQCYELSEVILSKNLSSIGAGAFVGNRFKEIRIPDGVSTIGADAFAGSNLEKIVIPDAVGMIESGLFSDSYNLTDVTLGSNVTHIDSYVFSGCSNLKKIRCLAMNVPSIEEKTFERKSFYNGRGWDENAISVYVPAESVETYQAAEGWNIFPNYIPSAFALAHEDPNEPEISYATFYNGKSAFDIETENVTAYTAKRSEEKLLLTPIEGITIPQGEAVVLKASEGVVTMVKNETNGTTGKNSSNILRGVDTNSAQDTDYYYYVLACGSHGMGFYKLASGAVLSEGKAYYMLNKSSSLPARFTMEYADDELGIETIEKESSGETLIYGLDGQLKTEKTSGINIVGGKVVFVAK